MADVAWVVLAVIVAIPLVIATTTVVVGHGYFGAAMVWWLFRVPRRIIRIVRDETDNYDLYGDRFYTSPSGWRYVVRDHRAHVVLRTKRGLSGIEAVTWSAASADNRYRDAYDPSQVEWYRKGKRSTADALATAEGLFREMSRELDPQWVLGVLHEIEGTHEALSRRAQIHRTGLSSPPAQGHAV